MPPITPTRDLHQIPEVTEGYALTAHPVRFKLYKPEGVRQMKGKKGRWQSMNEYGGWENLPDVPAQVWPDFVDVEQLMARNAQLEAALESISSNTHLTALFLREIASAALGEFKE